ncbi:hypothetical protein ES702_02569 [subsurface metagenome]
MGIETIVLIAFLRVLAIAWTIAWFVIFLMQNIFNLYEGYKQRKRKKRLEGWGNK